MIDVIYIFKYEGEKYNNAFKRLACSIRSLRNQGVNIIIINNSQQKLEIIDSTIPITCIHKPCQGRLLNKSRSINFGVKNCVQSEYFLMSDVDIIYGSQHIKNMLKV